MLMTPDDAGYDEYAYGEYAYDQYMSDLYEEHKVEAIEEFTDERLQSYYVANKLLAKPASDALSQARTLVDLNPTAAFVFAAIAMEVGLKATLLKPIVHGLVHTESVAALVTDLAILHSMDRYRKLLLQVLRDHGGVNLGSFKRSHTNRLLWEEIKEVQRTRNRIMHRAEVVSKDEADVALGVASAILETIFPAVVKKMGLHLHEGFRICDAGGCKD